ncbi:MAG: autotransporter-associated beta strand repeat-containing protein [Kiritimatiellae bacterium]|nr:autotransporter-associated beta strand repeat-containing protein [Kiritimatiellia bacterium]
MRFRLAILVFLLGGFALADELPELMRTASGDPVTTVQQWEAVRRPELLQTFTTNVFGVRSIERPASLTFEQAGTNCVMIGGRAIRKLIDIRYSGPGGNGCIRVNAFIPIRATPAPGFLLICNRDPEANIDPERVKKSPFWPVEEIVARGYAALAFYNGDVCPDRSTGFTVGVHAIFEQDPSVRTEESWATISAWAWGASRVMDWIETEPLLDAAHIAVIGHSRGGKTALWTGATDTRFAFVISNDSGCTGAKLNHMDLPSSESIASITRNFPHWFCTRYNSFAGKEFEMPFDQHELLALIAPRLLAVGSASQDNWAGQRGELASAVFASPAWELYGKRGMVGTNFPPVEVPMQEGNISYHLRSGEHNLVLYDWNRYMDFVDRHGWCFSPIVDNALVFDTTSGDQYHSTNLVSVGNLLKFGSNTLTLSGRNTLGGDMLVYGGTLCADWGEGLDSNHAVYLRGGCLSSRTGQITGRLGTGAGELSFTSGISSGFTAKGVPLTVDLDTGGTPLVWGTEPFAPSELILNGAEADAPLAFCTPLDLYGNTAVIRSVTNSVSLYGAITDSTGNGQLKIVGGRIDLCASSNFRLLRIANEKGMFTVTNDATLALMRLIASNGTMRVAESATLRTSSGGDAVQVGVGDTATLEQNGGTIDCSYHFQLGLAKGTGVFRQTAGTTTVLGVTSIGHDANSLGFAYLTGGVWSQPVAKNFRVGEWGDGYLEVSCSGILRCGNTLALRIADYASASGRVVLKTGGVIETPKVIGVAGTKREFTFDGGTLYATASSDNYLSGLTAFSMSERGGVVDTAGHNITFTQPLTVARLTPRMDADLVHRWSFNGDLKDSVGEQDATAIGAVTFVDGCARLAGGTFGTSYLNLGANALPKNGKPVTLEIWATQREIRDWSRIFDFGKGSANANYVTMTWTKSKDLQTDMIRIYNGAASQSNFMAPYMLGTEYHIAFVLEPLPNNGGWLATAYKQDAVTGVTLSKHAFTNDTWSLSSQDLDTCYLGHSRQSANHDAAADYNEVRVWNRALSEEELTISVLAGADYSESAEANGFEKCGEGVLTLTGTNSYAVNTTVTAGTLALAPDARLPESGAVALADGVMLALGGNSQTVATLTGSGTVSNGVLTVTGAIDPGTNATETATLTFSNASVTGTLELDATENAIDNVRCTSGLFDLTGLTLHITNLNTLMGTRYTLATSADGFVGQFAGTNLAGTPWQLAYHPNEVLLIRAATTLLIR